MMIKNIAWKVKEDFKKLLKYNNTYYKNDGSIDYGYYWRKRGRLDKPVFSSWQKERVNIALQYIKPGSVILDVGCGDGSILEYISNSLDDIKGIGLDIDEHMLSLVESKGMGAIKKDINSDLSDLPKVDYIIAFEILEHMHLPERLLLVGKDVVHDKIIFSVPNSGYYIHRLRFLFGKFPLQWISHPGEHLRFWTESDMKFWLDSLGLKHYKIILYQGVPVLNKIFPSLFAQGMIVVVDY